MFGFGKSSPAASSKKPADAALQAFTARLDRDGIKYTVHSERPIVFTTYNGDNFKSQRFSMFFDEDGKSIAMRVFSILNFSPDQLMYAYEFCNKMNMKYRWLRFYVDDDLELTAAMDAVITLDTCADECREILGRTVSIVDDVYGELIS